MSLLVTSCTMGKQPNRLLNKGPEYLRTRTNHGLFACDTRKSAVELLAASKAQYYSPPAKDKDVTTWDIGQDLAVSAGQHHRYNKYGTRKSRRKDTKPPRSKSEHNLTQLQLSQLLCDDEEGSSGDENNNSNTFDNSNDNIDENVVDVDHPITDVRSKVEDVKISVSTVAPTITNRSNVNIKSSCREKNKHCSTVIEKHSSDKCPPTHQNKIAKGDNCDQDPKISKDKPKPIPPPRKLKEKPIPPPRKRYFDTSKIPSQRPTHSCPATPATATPQLESRLLCASTQKESASKSIKSHIASSKSNICKNTSSSPLSPPVSKSDPIKPATKIVLGISLSSPARSSTFTPNKNQPPDSIHTDIRPSTQTIVEQKSLPAHPDEDIDKKDDKVWENGQRKHSLVESLTKRFTLLGTSPSTSESRVVRRLSQDPISPSQENNQSSISQHVFKATPVFITKSLGPNHPNVAKQVFPQASTSNFSNLETSKEATVTDKVSSISSKSCKKISDPSSEFYNKLEKQTLNKDIKARLNKSQNQPSDHKLSDTNSAISANNRRVSAMSMESADQAVYESDTNAAPVESMDGDNQSKQESSGGDSSCVVIGNSGDGSVGESQEIIRRNSSRSGRNMESDTSQSSGGHHFSGRGCSSSVPRSYSDISFRLSGGVDQGTCRQSRDSSVVSSHSRLSRASNGTELENFFNQMGLDSDALESVARLRQRSGGDTDRQVGKDGKEEGRTDENTFDSLSSLDSQDAASVYSVYSRSEHGDWATGGGGLGRASGGPQVDLGTSTHQHQQTSVVERNARIIKWLCNVKKAIQGGQQQAKVKTVSSACKTSTTAT